MNAVYNITDIFLPVSPNGIMFVKPEIRKSLLAKMLSELLDTRVMIKRAMKDYKEDSVSATFIRETEIAL